MEATYKGVKNDDWLRTNNWNRSHRKEDNFMMGYKIVGIDETNLLTLVDCRIYGTRAANTCCVWVSGEEYTQGSGKAGGGGYDRASAAVAEAVKGAGYELSEDISGVGDSAVERALLAIGKEIYKGPVHLIKCHG